MNYLLNNIFNTHPISPRLLNTITPEECNDILKEVVDLPVDIPHIYENRYMTKEEITYYFTECFNSNNTNYLQPVCLYLANKLECYYNKPDRRGWGNYYSKLLMFLIDKVRVLNPTINLEFSIDLNDIKNIIEKSDKQIFVLSGKTGSGKTKLSTDIIKELNPDLALFICDWCEKSELEKWLDEKYPIIYNRGEWDDVSRNKLIKLLEYIEKEKVKVDYIVFDYIEIFDTNYDNYELAFYLLDWCERNNTKIIYVSPRVEVINQDRGSWFRNYYQKYLITNVYLNYYRRTNGDIY